MPLFKGNTTKVFDAFLHLHDDQTIQVQWPNIELTEPGRAALAVLLDRLGYLGRAESWVEARLADSIRVVNALPGRDPEGGEIVRVLCPVDASDYSSWRPAMLDHLSTKRLEERRRAKPDRAPKLSAADKKKIEAAVPADLFAALHAETSDLRKQGWNRPPGSRWVDYSVPTNLVGTGPTRRARRRSRPLPTVARFAVASAVPPKLTNAVSLADRVRKTLIKYSDGAPAFTGRGGDEQRLAGHRHAHFLAESNRGDGRISHVAVYAEMGFDHDARRALETASRVWGHKGHDVELILLGIGQPADFAGTLDGACRLLERASRWQSRTPFVPTRHPKWRRSGEPRLDASGLQIGSPEHDLRRLLEASGFPKPVEVRAIDHTRLRGKDTSWLQFRLHRQSGRGTHAGGRGFGFEIEFADPVAGPIALGYNAHFGLGLFKPA
jgi:CRISPR-associated protein Csb2